MSQKLSKHMNIIILDNAVGMCVCACAAVPGVDKHHQEVCCYLSRDGASLKWLPVRKILGQLLENKAEELQL